MEQARTLGAEAPFGSRPPSHAPEGTHGADGVGGAASEDQIAQRVGSKPSTTRFAMTRSMLWLSLEEHPAITEVQLVAWSTLIFPGCQPWWAPVADGGRSFWGESYVWHGAAHHHSRRRLDVRARAAGIPTEGDLRQERFGITGTTNVVGAGAYRQGLTPGRPADPRRTTSVLTAAMLAYASGAGITAAAGTRLALQSILIAVFE